MAARAYFQNSNVPNENNMDLLRLVFASLVVFAHCYDLSNQAELLPLRQIVSSELAVEGFFILSGFLIAMSYDRSSSMKTYFMKRARRLYPAYFVVIVGAAVFFSTISKFDFAEYFNRETARYLAANLLFLNFLQPSLPGVFLDNPYGPAVNGALWTIKVEVSFYLAVPIIFIALRKTGKAVGLTVLFALSVIYREIFDSLYSSTGRGIWDLLAKQLPGQMMYFTAGMAAYLYFDVLKDRKLLCAIVGAGFFAASIATGAEALKAVAVGLLVFSAAFAPRIANAAMFGDFSYGIYIVHFPIVQSFVASGLFATSPVRTTFYVYATALAFAVCSWHLVEKRFLGRSNHYVRESEHASTPAGDTVSMPSTPDGPSRA